VTVGCSRRIGLRNSSASPVSFADKNYLSLGWSDLSQAEAMRSWAQATFVPSQSIQLRACPAFGTRLRLT
jgi:hypothetical protein